MTPLLLRRELRRQLPVALASAGLGLLALLLLRFGAPHVLTRVQVTDLAPYVPQFALVLVGLVTPWLLGVSSLAPDIETGAAAFLGALPVRRGRLAASRLAVAAGLTLVVVAPFAIFALVSAQPHRLEAREAAGTGLLLLTLGLTPLAAGALLGLVTGRSIPAFAATPILVAVLSAFATWILIGFDQFGELTSFVALTSVPLLVVALVLVGVRRGVGVRPGDGLRFGLAGVGALLLTTGGLGGAALALGTATTVWHERSWARRGPLVVWQDVRHRPSYPYFSNGEVVAFVPGTLPIWLRGEHPVGIHLGPLLSPTDLSPDGGRLLAYDFSGAGVVVVDATSGAELLRRDAGWIYEAPPAANVADGFVTSTGQGWRRGVPVCVDTWTDPAGTSLLALDGERVASPIGGSRVTSLLGGWALLSAPDGLHAWDLEGGACPRRWPDVRGGRLVGSGLVALREPDGALRLVRLETGATTLRAPLGGLPGTLIDVEPSPDGAAAVVWRQVSDPGAGHDPLLVVGETITPLEWHAPGRTSIVWSPDGQRVAFTGLGVIDVARPAELRPAGIAHGHPLWGVQPLGFADRRTLYTSVRDELFAVDVETGEHRVLPHPLSAAER